MAKRIQSQKKKKWYKKQSDVKQIHITKATKMVTQQRQKIRV